MQILGCNNRAPMWPPSMHRWRSCATHPSRPTLSLALAPAAAHSPATACPEPSPDGLARDGPPWSVPWWPCARRRSLPGLPSSGARHGHALPQLHSLVRRWRNRNDELVPYVNVYWNRFVGSNLRAVVGVQSKIGPQKLEPSNLK